MIRLLLLIGLICVPTFGQKMPSEIDRVLDRVELSSPIEYENLRIYPIELRYSLDRTDYLTLDEAVAKGLLEIKEVGSGQVSAVHVKNHGKAPVFIMTGEIVTGAKQDRMIKEDVLIPAKSGWVKVPVFCTERGRWVAKSETFNAPKMAASGKVRQKARIYEEQSRVWAEVSKAKRSLDVAGATEAFQDVYNDEKVRKEAKAYQDRLSSIPKTKKRTIGVVVTVDDQILAVDIFANHNLFSSLWEKLLNSYIVDALQGERRNTVSIVEARRFLNKIREAGFEKRHTPGLGKLYRFESPDLAGGALTYNKSVIHLDAFPSEEYRSSSPPSLQKRRESRFED